MTAEEQLLNQIIIKYEGLLKEWDTHEDWDLFKAEAVSLINQFKEDVEKEKVRVITEFLEGIKGSQYDRTGKVPEQTEIIYDSMIRGIKEFF